MISPRLLNGVKIRAIGRSKMRVYFSFVLFLFCLEGHSQFSSYYDLDKKLRKNPETGDHINIRIGWACLIDSFVSYTSQSIDSISLLLKKYPRFVFAIEAYSDCRGPEDYNILRTQHQADTLRNIILIRAGTDTSNLIATGKGESDLLLKHCNCELSDPGNRICSEAEHQLNRRYILRLIQIRKK